MKALIAGWAGTGKSTLALALQAQGLPALDSDEVPDLSSWQDLETGKTVQVDYSKPIDFDKLDWVWSPAVLERVLAEHEELFFCGNAANLWDFVDTFDVFFVFTIDTQTQRERLMSRTNNVYGKEPSVLAYTLAAQKQFEDRAINAGAVELDATLPTESIVRQVLERTRAR